MDDPIGFLADYIVVVQDDSEGSAFVFGYRKEKEPTLEVLRSDRRGRHGG